MKDDIRNACNILNSLVADLTMAVTLLKEYEKKQPPNELHRQVMYRLCFSAIFINCTKYVEFCTKYSKLLNTEVPEYNKLRNRFQESIKQKGIIAFRNDYIGHIHSKSLQRPLSNEEIHERFITIIGSNNALEFLNWICPDDFNNSNKTLSLVGSIKIIRDVLYKKL